MCAFRDDHVGREETRGRAPPPKPSCKTCGRSFPNVESLWRHVRSLRTRAADGHADHECPWPQCGRVFADRSMRARHTAHHPTVAAAHRPTAAVLTCELCGVTVRTTASYDGHVAVWHPHEVSATCFACRTFHGNRAGLACHVALEHDAGTMRWPRPLSVRPPRARSIVDGQAGPPGDRRVVTERSWRFHTAKELDAANRLLTFAGGPGPRVAMTIISSRPCHSCPYARTAR